MGSLGGLDVPYGANLQIVRTNILILETDANTGCTVANAQAVLDAGKSYLPAPLKPDYIALAVAAGTEGYHATSTPTEIAQNGVLTSLTEVPVAGMNFGATNANQRGMAWETIIGLGACVINANDTAVADDLFTAATGTTTGEEVGTGEYADTSILQGTLMAAQANAANLTGGASSTHGVGGADGKVQFLNVASVYVNSALHAGGALSAFAPSITSLATFNDFCAGAGGILSITSLASQI